MRREARASGVARPLGNSYQVWRVEVLGPLGLARSGTGARARGPVAVGLTELGGVAGSGRGRKWRQRVPGRREVPPGRWRGPVVGPSSESSQDWSGTMAVPASESASLVALIRVAVRRSPGTYALSSAGGPGAASRQQSESNLRGSSRG